MTKVVKLKGGMNLPLEGKAEEKMLQPNLQVAGADTYAMQPQDFPGMKPKPLVKEGQEVKAGDALFCSKEQPEIVVTSPVSGVVTLVERGDRRKLLSVQVKAEATQQAKSFDTTKANDKQGVKQLLLESGLLAYVRQLPYAVVPRLDAEPKAVFVSAFNDKPLAASFAFQLKGEEEAWQKGITALSKVAPVYVGINLGQTEQKALVETQDATVTAFEGKCPAGNVGVHVNHLAPIAKGQTVWTVRPEVVLFIGRLMLTGTVDLSIKLALGGSEVQDPGYYNVKVGQKLATVLEGQAKAEGNRIVAGSPISGVQTSAEGYVSAAYSEVAVIPEGDHADEMLGWIMPRPSQLSKSRSYLSWLMPGRLFKTDARIKGGERHMIMSGEYDEVLPMDIYAEYLIKAIIAQDIDKMEQLGIYEVAPEDFAVAEFVDSSKLPLQKIVREGLDLMLAEA